MELPDADIRYVPGILETAECVRLFNELREGIEWQQEHLKMFGKVHPFPRLTAWYGDAGVDYSYSGVRMTATAWTNPLVEIKQLVEEETNRTFNSVLLNFYRNGSDSVGWHSDNEPELGLNPVIASVSLGAVRKFQLRHRMRKEVRCDLWLNSGSLLIMSGATQVHWEHQVPKTAKAIEGRINLTFRHLAT